MTRIACCCVAVFADLGDMDHTARWHHIRTCARKQRAVACMYGAPSTASTLQ